MPTRSVVRITLAVAATALALFALYRIRHVLLLVGIAAFLALALEPGVTFLQRRLKSRQLSVGLMIALIVLFIGLFFASIVPPIIHQAQSLVRRLPEIRRTTLENPSSPLGHLEKQFHLTEKLKSGTDTLTRMASSLPKVLGTILTFVADLLVVLVLTLYFLLHAPSIKAEGIRLMPEASRKRTARISEIVFEKVGGWMEGNVLVSIIAGVVTFIGLVVIGVPYPAALAMWVAIADLIPMVGAMLGAVVCVTVAFFGGIFPGVVTAVFFLIYQQVENYLIGPRVMKRAVDVSAASVIIAALVGGTLLGPVGILLAVPAAASLKVITNELWRAPTAQP